MKVFSNEDVRRLLTMDKAMDALEAAYRALGQGRAVSTPRVDSLMPIPESGDEVYAFKQMAGTVVGEVQALRLNSDVISWPLIDGMRRRVKVPKADGRWVGLVLLFDARTGKPLALMPDGELQHLRVAAASGLAARLLAPSGRHTMALLGTGWQAETMLEAISSQRACDEIRVFSPNSDHRLQFVQKMQTRVAPPLVAVDSAVEAVDGATLVASATNSMAAILDPNWITPGRYFSAVKVQEVDEAFISRTQLVLHSRQQSKATLIVAPGVSTPESETGWWSRIPSGPWPDLIDVLEGTVSVPPSKQPILFVNNVGMGLQFAACGDAVYQAGLEAGVGIDLPDGWFLQDVHP